MAQAEGQDIAVDSNKNERTSTLISSQATLLEEIVAINTKTNRAGTILYYLWSRLRSFVGKLEGNK